MIPYINGLFKKKYNDYWDYMKDSIHFNPSNEFKQLFFRLVSFTPEERPTIEEILNTPWMQEINNLNNDQMNDLEDEVRQEFKNIKVVPAQNNNEQ